VASAVCTSVSVPLRLPLNPLASTTIPSAAALVERAARRTSSTSGAVAALLSPVCPAYSRTTASGAYAGAHTGIAAPLRSAIESTAVPACTLTAPAASARISA